MRLTVRDKGGVIVLVPERPMRAYRGIARGASPTGLREKEGPTLILVDGSRWIE
jgi:hypothetical protein